MLTKKYNYKNKVVTLRGNNVLNSMRYGRNWKVNKVNKSKKTKTGKTGKKSLMRGGSIKASNVFPVIALTRSRVGAVSKVSMVQHLQHLQQQQNQSTFRPRSGAVSNPEYTLFNNVIKLTFDTSLSKDSKPDKDFLPKDDIIKQLKSIGILNPTGIEQPHYVLKNFYNLHLPELLKAIYTHLGLGDSSKFNLQNKNDIQFFPLEDKITTHEYDIPITDTKTNVITSKKYRFICDTKKIQNIKQYISNTNVNNTVVISQQKTNKIYLTFNLNQIDVKTSPTQISSDQVTEGINIYVDSVSLLYFTPPLTQNDSKYIIINKTINIIFIKEKPNIKYSVKTSELDIPKQIPLQSLEDTKYIPVPVINIISVESLLRKFVEDNSYGKPLTILEPTMVIDNKFIYKMFMDSIQPATINL